VIPIKIEFQLTPESQSNLAKAPVIFHEELGIALQRVVQFVVAKVVLIIQDKDIFNTGELMGSIEGEVEMAGSLLSAIVGTGVEYAKYQEFGTVPHFVSFTDTNGDIRSIYDEARLKWGWQPPPGQNVYQLSGNGRLYLVTASEKKPVSGVFVTGRAQPFLFPGWAESEGFAEQEIALACQRAAVRMATL
jgi:hypothetical protein